MLQDPDIATMWKSLTADFASAVLLELQESYMTINGRTFRFKYFPKEDRPEQGYTLVIDLHGDGNCPAEINEQQYKRHMHLYDAYLPTGIIWFVPRSPEQASDMWWKGYL